MDKIGELADCMLTMSHIIKLYECYFIFTTFLQRFVKMFHGNSLKMNRLSYDRYMHLLGKLWYSINIAELLYDRYAFIGKIMVQYKYSRAFV